VVTGLGAVFIDKAGRKPLLIVNPTTKHFTFKLSFSFKGPFVHNILIVISWLHCSYLDQDWWQVAYLQQLHSTSRYIPTWNPIASGF